MESLYFLIPGALLFCIIIIGLFVWAIRNQQFDDLDRESQRILEDDENNHD
jgi:cbb3-type cytochrome oxidase maturation protein